jgi:protocatechuate 3,4-dioxygenase beta subunit
MRKAAVFLVATAAIGVAVSLGALLLVDSSGEEAEAARGGSATETEGAHALPTTGELAAARELRSEAGEAGPASATGAPVAAAEPGTPLRFTGQVTDDLGQPLADAQVFFVPNANTLAARGWKRDGWSWIKGHSLGDFRSTKTGADGRFALEGRLVRLRPGDKPEQGAPWLPGLVVLAAGFAPYGHECQDLRAESDDVGTLRLRRGASLAGRVLDESGAPLAGARVQFHADENDEETAPPDALAELLEAALTGKDGRFELAELPAATLRGTASAPGRLEHDWESVELKEGEDKELEPIVLGLGGTLAGVVLDPAGRPVAGANVAVLELPIQQRSMPMQYEYYARSTRVIVDESRRTVTDAAGRFELRGLPGDSHSLLAHATGLAWTVQHDLPNGATDVELRLGEPGVLEVSVVDSDTHAPIEATVEARLRAFAWEQTPLAVEPGALGHVLVRDAGLSGTHLIVTAPNHARAETDAPGVERGARSEFTVELTRGWSLSGQVTDAAHAPLPEAEVEVQRLGDNGNGNGDFGGLGYIGEAAHDNGPSWSTVRPNLGVDAQGHFTVESLEAGSYRVVARAAGHARRESETAVLGGTPPAELALALDPAGDVRGLLVDSKNKPLPHHNVMLAAPSGEGSQWVACDTAGRFVFHDVAPGAWVVQAGEVGSAPVTVVAGEVAQVRLQLAPASTLVVIVSSAGRPAPGVSVSWSAERGGGNSGTTDAQGRCSFSLQPTSIDVRLNSPGGGTLQAKLAVLPNETRTLTLELPSGRIDALVRDAATGQPAAGVPVMAVRLNDKGERAVLEDWEDPDGIPTGADGSVALEHLEPGTWQVWAGGKGWIACEPVKLSLDSDAHSVSFDVHRAPVIRGRVLQPDGKPAANTRLCLVQLSGTEPPDDEDGDAVTDNDGRFQFTEISEIGRYAVAVPRKYWFESLRPDDVLAQTVVELKDGQSVELTLTLTSLP